jgi:hypothetical protein
MAREAGITDRKTKQQLLAALGLNILEHISGGRNFPSPSAPMVETP